jgi:hypothetical protein
VPGTDESEVHPSEDLDEASAWVWIDSSGQHWLLDDFEHSTWASALRVVFYGSSHLRELHNEILRWHLGVPGDHSLPAVVTKIRSRSCDFGDDGCTRCLDRHGFIGSSPTPLLDGVDLEACGPPGYRVVKELSETVAIGFKTYIHTPLAEALFLERLSRDGLRQPDVVLVDCGVWGPRDRTGFNEQDGSSAYDYMLPSFVEEVEYFVSWVHTHFVDSLVVWIYGFCEHQWKSLLRFDIQQSIVDAVEKSRTLGRHVDADLLVNKSKLAGCSCHYDHRGVLPDLPATAAVRPSEMRCAHGGAGPALRILAKIVKMAIDQYELRKMLP